MKFTDAQMLPKWLQKEFPFRRRMFNGDGYWIHFVDEGLTTWEAEEVVRQRGIHIRDAKKSGLLDREAARALLRGWLRDADKQGFEEGEPES